MTLPDTHRDVLAALRRATAASHERVEAHFATLLSEAPTVATYGRFLQAMYSFHAALEPALDAAVQRTAPALPRGPVERVQALGADLTALGLPLPTRLCAVPRLDTAARTLGAAYVIDGSMLGARVLHRHLVDRMPQGALSFLAVGGERAVVAFRSLIAALSRVESAAEREEVVEAAVATFDVLDRHLSA